MEQSVRPVLDSSHAYCLYSTPSKAAIRTVRRGYAHLRLAIPDHDDVPWHYFASVEKVKKTGLSEAATTVHIIWGKIEVASGVFRSYRLTIQRGGKKKNLEPPVLEILESVADHLQVTIDSQDGAESAVA